MLSHGSAMASPFTLTLLGVLFVLSAASVAHSATAPAADCSTIIFQMADCLPYVSEGGAATPQGTCCSGLKTVLKSNPECLCEAFRNSKQFGRTLNLTRAVSLPAACHVNAPSVSKCGLSFGPSAGPAALSPSSIAGAPDTGTEATVDVPAPAPVPHGTGSSAGFTTFVGLTLLVPVISALF